MGLVSQKKGKVGMGVYLNPGNEGFRVSRNSEYVDKSGLIAVVNQVLDTERKLSCIARPRRFGKSMAAKMLCAYYDASCDSAGLFDDLCIARDSSYREHLNQYNICYLDMTAMLAQAGDRRKLVAFTTEELLRECRDMYPEAKDAPTLSESLFRIAEATGRKFIAIIDEWDAPIRDSDCNAAMQKEYLEFLRMLFKNSGITDKVFAGAYMTGILPIKKDGSQSAISAFREYSMLMPEAFAPFVGFTEDEVRGLCKKHGADFAMMKQWYDGYSLEGIASIYNPNSVMEAIWTRKYRSYWQMSSAADSLFTYINMDYDGLSRAVASLLGGNRIPVNVYNFDNDPRAIGSCDDVLTLLVHFGYLSYDPDTEKLRIPNDEIRMEFDRQIRRVTRDDTIRRVQESGQLILDTVEMREEAVAAQIEKIHMEECAPLHYNNEQSLRSVIKLAYFAYRDEYLKLEELSGGKGYADIVYLPKKHSGLPILVIELKWDETAEGAIAQIRNRDYPAAFRDYGTEILLVGISYDRDDAQKRHHCRIEQYEL